MSLNYTNRDEELYTVTDFRPPYVNGLAADRARGG